MPESVLVPLLDAIWKNEARNETDYDQILTRVVKTDRDETHKLDGFISYPNFYVISEDISCGGENDFPGETGATFPESDWGLLLGLLFGALLGIVLGALFGRAIGFFS